MKNIQVKHGQFDTIIFPQKISFESSKQLSDHYLADSSIIYFTFDRSGNVPLFVRGSNKKQGRGTDTSNFTKGGTF